MWVDCNWVLGSRCLYVSLLCCQKYIVYLWSVGEAVRKWHYVSLHVRNKKNSWQLEATKTLETWWCRGVNNMLMIKPNKKKFVTYTIVHVWRVLMSRCMSRVLRSFFSGWVPSLRTTVMVWISDTFITSNLEVRSEPHIILVHFFYCSDVMFGSDNMSAWGPGAAYSETFSLIFWMRWRTRPVCLRRGGDVVTEAQLVISDDTDCLSVTMVTEDP